MEGFGIVLQSIGAILIAYSQFEMNRTISVWLQTLDLTVEQLANNERDVVRTTGVDSHWDRDLRRDKWMSPTGWLLFMIGYCLLLGHVVFQTPGLHG